LAGRAEQEVPVVSDSPERTALVNERLAETLEDVNALRDRPRQVLLMHELWGLSDTDGRRRRTAGIRTHLRGCRACQSWQRARRRF
jgi:hypothetical protein